MLGAGGEITASVFEHVTTKLLSIAKDFPEASALKEAYSDAGLAFLTCFDYPEQADLCRTWLLHIKELSEQVFADEFVKASIGDIVLHGISKEEDLLIAFQNTWANNYGTGAELSLPLKKGLVWGDAIHAFVQAFEHSVEAHPILHTFLLASRLRKIVTHLENGIKVIGVDALVSALNSISGQQSQIVELLSQLSSWGISIERRDDCGHSRHFCWRRRTSELAQKLRLSLERDPEKKVAATISEYRAKIRRSVHFMPLGSLAVSGFNTIEFDTKTSNIPFEDVFSDLHGIFIDDREDDDVDRYSLDLSKLIKNNATAAEVIKHNHIAWLKILLMTKREYFS